MKLCDSQKQDPIFIIAEAANSHEGSLSAAKALVDAAVQAGADAVKFQKFVTEELLVASHPQFSLFKKLEFKESEWQNLFDYARKRGICIFADVFDIPSALFLASLQMEAYKIHSTDLSNPDLLSFVAAQKKRIFLGVGASSLDEIATAISFLHDDVVLMHGFQAFPTKLEETNLSLMRMLHDKFGKPVGFMDHVDGGDPLAEMLPLVAVGFGCSVIEKHITLDRSKKGIDHESALNPDEFKRFVIRCRQIESTVGSGEIDFSADEKKYRQKMKKSIVARRDIQMGEIMQKDMFAFKRAGEGISPMNAEQLLGRVTTKSIKKDEVFSL